jgi:guanine deaminase
MTTPLPVSQNTYFVTAPNQAGTRVSNAKNSSLTFQDYRNMSDTIELSNWAREHKLFPIAAMIVAPNGTVIAKSTNTELDPKSPFYGTPIGHAEISTIYKACKTLGTRSLQGYRLFTSCEPCPMCLAAMQFAGIKDFVYANSINDTYNFKQYGFNDKDYYQQATLPVEQRKMPGYQLLRNQAFAILQKWQKGLEAQGIYNFNPPVSSSSNLSG